MPFTYGCFIVGGLALSGIPPFSGFFSKEEILALTGAMGGWHWALYAAGYIGAFLTALYTFRMIFIAFHGEPCPEARELEEGHLHHAEQPFNPADGEIEDTDVGFPGPGHAIAERAWPMRVAMSVLAIGAFGAGLVQIPQVDSVVTNFLRPTFAASPLYNTKPSTGLMVAGLIGGTVIGLAGIAICWQLWVRKPGSARAWQERLHPLYVLFAGKWFFDEAIDLTVVRPAAALGRFAAGSFERLVIEDGLVGGAAGLTKAGSAIVRSIQSGLLRYYAAMIVLGVAAVGLYMLLQS